MSPLSRGVRLLACGLVCSVLLRAGGGGGYDTPTPANLALDMLGPDRAQAPQPGRTWLRLRGVNGLPVPLAEDADAAAREARAAEILAARADLLELRAAGYRLAGMLRWDTRAWPAVRPGPVPSGNQAPLDLGVAYVRAFALGRTYGDVMDFWEFDNEPEIFFAETADVFAAFHKAVAWGFWRGAADAGWAGAETGRVLMAAPALPPGPHFAQLMANGHLAYTEGFNYHYYGFAEDFDGVHERFIETVGARSVGLAPTLARWLGRAGAGASGDGLTRRWPVLLSEWGYSMLDGYDAQTVAGRVAQWRFFKDVAERQERWRIAGPMAFLLRPYYEHGMREYGLGMPTAERRAAHYGFVVDEGGGLGAANSTPGSRKDAKTQRSNYQSPFTSALLGAARLGGGGGGREYLAGGLTFRPEDFAAAGARGRVERWMERIGEPAGEGIEASPALAWLRADAAERERRGAAERRLQAGAGATGKAGRGLAAASARVARSGDWWVRTEAPSPVVLDLVAGAGTRMVKSYHGYWVAEPAAGAVDRREGAAELVWYHFGDQPAEVRWAWPEGVAAAEGADASVVTGQLRLEPGERRVVPVRLSAPWGRMEGRDLGLAAEVRTGGQTTVARWATRLYAEPAGYAPIREVDLRSFPAEAAAANRGRLLARPLAAEEPPLVEAAGSRWLTTPGARVEETDEGFNVLIEALPGVATRPVVVELPLPEGPAFTPGLMLSYAYRVRPAWPGEQVEELRPDDPDPTRRRPAGRLGLVMESYFRTAGGHLYSTQPRLVATESWKSYFQPWESFTPHFLGRTTPTNELTERSPAALVFFIRPTRLPAVVEIRSLSLAEWGAPGRRID